MSPLDHFRAIWMADFEFHQPPGEQPTPICLVAKEYRSGRVIRLWQDELQQRRAPPFSTGPDTLYIAYLASVEIGCHLALGWPVPERILDLYIEFRARTNGLPTHGRSLLGALAYFSLDALGAAEKVEMRELAMRGGPWSNDERVALLKYCESDVDGLARLLPVMLTQIDLPRALLRGRYMTAAAKVEHAGVPIDIALYNEFKVNWNRVLETIIREYDTLSLYEGASFRAYRFRQWLADTDRAWPYLDTGSLDLDNSAFAMMAESDSTISPIAKLRATLAELRLPTELSIGADGRNRCLLSPFASRTGRNQPSNAKFIFGPAAWLRGLIRPGPGQAVAYVDWSQQEFGIAASLSGDAAMIAAYESGDPYLRFGQQARLIPPDGTGESHGVERERCKSCVLGVQYGMSAWSLARRIKQQPAYARELLELHRRTYQTYWQWSDVTEYAGMLGGSLRTVFGWPLHVGPNANPRSLRNFPIQANGAELLRLACCIATERGISVVAPVHDAILVEGSLDDIDNVVNVTQKAMVEASQVVLDGFTLRSEAKIVKYPDRLLDDKKTRPTWDRVMEIIAKAVTSA